MKMEWSDDYRYSGTLNVCSRCGRKIKPPVVWWVQVTDGGRTCVPADVQPDIYDPGYMGYHPLGGECAEKYFKGYAVKLEEPPPE